MRPDGDGGPGGVSAGSDLERDVGALKRFQTRVNALLTKLESSAGGGTKVAEQRIARASLSGGNAAFAEADGLYSQYNRVHEALVSLSKMLGDQIEGLSIGVHAADVGYDNVEEAVRRRYAAIQERLDLEQEKSGKRDAGDNTKSERGW